MISFILNNRLIRTEEQPGMVLLDFIRYEMNLTGTKVGCREGDCGACTVLEGSLHDGKVNYKSIVSCLTPLGNVQGKHIVTIEGLQKAQMSPVQQAIIDNAGTQCGFCTPGFVMSLTAHSLDAAPSNEENVLASISGNICRCTGYKSIERAAVDLSKALAHKNARKNLDWLIENAFIPEYFREIAARLVAIQDEAIPFDSGIPIGAGTDLFVQKADQLFLARLQFLRSHPDLLKIETGAEKCFIGASVTVTDMLVHKGLQSIFPKLSEHLKLISSEPIRNMGTVAGNIMNASPIADVVVFLLALDAKVHLKNNEGGRRSVLLRKFYHGYKQTDLKEGELIEKVEFAMPGAGVFFNFEKVSKRRFLDIASVNSAMRIQVEGNKILKANLSAGGVFPFPFYAEKTAQFLTGKMLDEQMLLDASEILQEEVAPISDIRGTKEYKRLLLRQLFFAHFIELFPGFIAADHLLKKAVLS
jgi:xanthine dehydrogenase small subunit